MGKASRLKRERRERRDNGIPEPVKVALSNLIGRKVVAAASHKGVVAELSKGTVTDQTQRLETMVGDGSLAARQLRKAIEKNAPKEMDKGIKKFQKQGKAITVDALLEDVRNEAGFLPMCERVGLTYEWFEALARERMDAQGVK